MKSILLVFIMLFLGSTVQASFYQGEVARIYPSDEYVFFRLKNDECITGSQYYYFSFDNTSEDGMYAAKNWYSMLLASAMAGKPVRVKVKECPGEGNVRVQYIFQDY
ncbi:hypothetical protein [Endozoicomonas arenosclerae]|uniref:hypothetical protein n=1 Tax=Endozoicomonas arenosclerae TaxID=1633495 RepID=UPI000783263A|nr:hypothetical protein [Endozoicomonas arenosclerae]